MTVINLNQFAVKALSALTAAFPSDSVVMTNVTKLNGTYQAIEVKPENGFGAILYIDKMYKSYEEYSEYAEHAFECAIADVIEQVKSRPSLLDDAQARIFDYNQASNNFLLRLSNARTNTDFLKNVPHRILGGDLALTVHVKVGDDHGQPAMTVVNNQLLQHYGIDENALFEKAFEVASKNYPPMTKSLGAMVGESIGTSDIPTSVPMTIVSNKQLFNGASVLGYPCMLQAIAEMNGGHDYIVLPSSIHEVIVVPATVDLSGCLKTVREINARADCMSAEEVLSDHLYRYSVERHALESLVLD